MMTLRRKILLGLITVLVPLLLIAYAALRTLMYGSYDMLEHEAVTRNLERASNAFQSEAIQFERTVHDWSSWDTLYNAMQSNKLDTIRQNLNDNIFWSQRIDLMMFVNNDNEIVYTNASDLDPNAQLQLLPSFADYARTDTRFLPLMTATPILGYVNIGGKPVLIASRPILRGDDSGPKAGTLIWAENFDADELTTLSSLLRVSVDIRGLDAADLPQNFLSAAATLTAAQNQDVADESETTVLGYTLLRDIYGEPTLIVQTSQERTIYEEAQSNLSEFIIALAIVGLIFGAAVIILLDRLVLSRLNTLSQYLRIQPTTPLEVTGSDELSRLTSAVYEMMDSVSDSRTKMQQLNTGLESRVSERTLELDHQKSQLQAIMDTMGEGLIYCVDGLITYVNHSFVELMGYQASDLVGKPFAVLDDQRHPMDTPILLLLPDHYETTFRRRDGTTVNVALTATPVDEDDQRRRRVIIVRDITQELEVKRQKDYFFARASHDLRTPLASLMSRVYLLEKKPEQLQTHLKALDTISNQMYELINDLLDVSRVEQGAVVLEQRTLVLQSIVEEIIEIETVDADLKMIELRADLTDTPLHVYGDPLRLKQVIANLVSNAIRYTPGSGHIQVNVEQEDCEKEQQSYAVVSVCDDGIGISKENLPHVFEPFFRVSKSNGVGSGLGLYIVKEIVTLHGGDISVTSELGKGTTFVVKLALVSSPVDQPLTGEVGK